MFVVFIVVKIDVNILNISKNLLRFKIRKNSESTTIRRARKILRKIKMIKIIDNRRNNNRRSDNERSNDWNAKRKFDNNRRIFKDALLIVRSHLSFKISTSNDLLLQTIQLVDGIFRINSNILRDRIDDDSRHESNNDRLRKKNRQKNVDENVNNRIKNETRRFDENDININQRLHHS